MIIDRGRAARGALGLKIEVVTLWLLTESWKMLLNERIGHSQETLLNKQGVELSEKLEASAVGPRSPSHMSICQSSPWGLHLCL